MDKYNSKKIELMFADSAMWKSGKRGKINKKKFLDRFKKSLTAKNCYKKISGVRSARPE
jgi:hypothetical protein